jgi:hypothetical protein
MGCGFVSEEWDARRLSLRRGPGGPAAKHQPSPEGLGIALEAGRSAVGAPLYPQLLPNLVSAYPVAVRSTTISNEIDKTR